MKKQIVDKEVFEKHYNGMRACIPLEDIPVQFLQHGKSYLIDIDKQEEKYYSDSSSDAQTLLTIYERREETDEEFEKRKAHLNRRNEVSKKERLELYHKLKKEFDNENRTD